ncbi:protein bric-a-brac 2-like isoform X1 [Limulus polyphemus]|uniref:Protein bric-a-brac 2-like isoform X1 n=1 Tax=Limulus polyphemus TaxID=6850 RepID=A0ABM1SZ77_LIMPO|nr:protein bric-a-brac 2-like isoform X1 [Limulus polyphemus]XP_022248933.1 protein bric-a-brac 2-like isoform X1 [Limulus polyphemus]XP_022248934.1 protein bric-a-brac 2-like isoform X1 [Limulus polyphemus]
MGSQQFCLKWNDHHSHVFSFFESLLFRGLFVDVTLVCEGMKMKAHKMVLSACSPLFQSIFEENPCKHPVIIMKDIKYVELKAVLDFIYHGEVNVSQDQLSTLLKTARTLKVRGLAVDGQDGAVVEEVITQYQSQKQQLAHTPKRKRVKPCRRPGSDIGSDEDPVPVKIQETSSPEVSCLSDHSIDLSGGSAKKVFESSKTSATQDTSGLCSTVNTETSSKSSHEENMAPERKVEHNNVLRSDISSTEPSVAGGSTLPLSMMSRVWEPEATQLALPSSHPIHTYSSRSLETHAELATGKYQLQSAIKAPKQNQNS